jgi:aryl-alcohol dehydrogenase-like predicted oxidoreductase
MGRPGMAAMVLTDRNFEIVEAVEAVAANLGATPVAVAIAWCLTRRGVTSVITGPRTLEQLQDYLPAFELKLPEDAIKRLSDASRPGGRPATPPAAPVRQREMA